MKVGMDLKKRGFNCQIANVDQIPLLFAFISGPTYETINSSSVLVHGASSGLDKCQRTVQFMVGLPSSGRLHG